MYTLLYVSTLTIIKIVIFIVIFSPIDPGYLNANDVTINHFTRSIIVSHDEKIRYSIKAVTFFAHMWRLSRSALFGFGRVSHYSSLVFPRAISFSFTLHAATLGKARLMALLRGKNTRTSTLAVRLESPAFHTFENQLGEDVGK